MFQKEPPGNSREDILKKFGGSVLQEHCRQDDHFISKETLDNFLKSCNRTDI